MQTAACRSAGHIVSSDDFDLASLNSAPKLWSLPMIPARKLAPAICLALMTAGASAQTGEPVERASLSSEARMNMAVTAHVFDYFAGYEGLLETQDVFVLSLVAKMKAVALVCEGFDLDPMRYTAVLGEIIGPLFLMSRGADPDHPSANLLVTIAMSGYSISVGGNLAVAAYNPDGFCAAGEEMRAQLAEDNASQYLIWADQD
jgi:hypothetical protein